MRKWCHNASTENLHYGISYGLSACNQPLDMFKTMRTGKQKLQPSSSTSQASKPSSTTQIKGWGHWSWKLLVLPTIYHLGKSLHRWVSRRGSKKWQRWSVHQAPQPQIHQEVCGYRAAVNKLQSWSLHLACSSPDPEPERETSYNTVFFTDCWSILQGIQLAGGDQIFSNIRQELSLPKNKTSVTLQWIPSPCGFRGNEVADRLWKMGSKLDQSAHPMS